MVAEIVARKKLDAKRLARDTEVRTAVNTAASAASANHDLTTETTNFRKAEDAIKTACE